MEHTKEPWTYNAKLSGSENHKGFSIRSSFPSGLLANVMPLDMDGTAGQANARRICAAVNALAGIPTEALEAGIVGGMVEAIREASDLLAERIYGNSARSPAHNARVKLDAILSRLGGSND